MILVIGTPKIRGPFFSETLIWVAVNIMVLFWILSIVRHTVFRDPKRDHNFDNHPYQWFNLLEPVPMLPRALRQAAVPAAQHSRPQKHKDPTVHRIVHNGLDYTTPYYDTLCITVWCGIV